MERILNTLTSKELSLIVRQAYCDSYPMFSNDKQRLFLALNEVTIRHLGDLIRVDLNSSFTKVVTILKDDMTVSEAIRFIRKESGNFEPSSNYKSYNFKTMKIIESHSNPQAYACYNSSVKSNETKVIAVNFGRDPLGRPVASFEDIMPAHFKFQIIPFYRTLLRVALIVFLGWVCCKLVIPCAMPQLKPNNASIQDVGRQALQIFTVLITVIWGVKVWTLQSRLRRR